MRTLNLRVLQYKSIIDLGIDEHLRDTYAHIMSDRHEVVVGPSTWDQVGMGPSALLPIQY